MAERREVEQSRFSPLACLTDGGFHMSRAEVPTPPIPWPRRCPWRELSWSAPHPYQPQRCSLCLSAPLEDEIQPHLRLHSEFLLAMYSSRQAAIPSRSRARTSSSHSSKASSPMDTLRPT